MSNNILLAEEVATMIRVDRQRVYELVRMDAIPFIKLGERQYRFSRIAIENWLENGGTINRLETSGTIRQAEKREVQKLCLTQ